MLSVQLACRGRRSASGRCDSRSRRRAISATKVGISPETVATAARSNRLRAAAAQSTSCSSAASVVADPISGRLLLRTASTRSARRLQAAVVLVIAPPTRGLREEVPRWRLKLAPFGRSCGDTFHPHRRCASAIIALPRAA